MTNPSSSQLQKQLVCAAIVIANCSDPEIRRLKILEMWATLAPKLSLGNTPIVSYLDNIATQALAYKSKLGFNLAWVIANGINKVKISPYKLKKQYNNDLNMSEIEIEMTLFEWNFVCINSSTLRAICQIRNLSPNLNEISWVNLTFILPAGSNPSTLTLNLTADSILTLTNK